MSDTLRVVVPDDLGDLGELAYRAFRVAVEVYRPQAAASLRDYYDLGKEGQAIWQTVAATMVQAAHANNNSWNRN